MTLPKHLRGETPQIEELHRKHFPLMLNENHDGSSRCDCPIAVEIRSLVEARDKERVEYLKERDRRKAAQVISPDPVASAIRGALLSTIDAHGPITKKFIPSAVKRIVGNLANIGDGSGPSPYDLNAFSIMAKDRRGR